MRFSSRVFLLAFLPTALLLLVGFWVLQTLVAAQVRDQLGASLRQTHVFIAQMRETYELQSGAVAASVADNAALKAGFELVDIEGGSPTARLTLEDQLLVAATELGFDLIAATDKDGEPIAAIVRVDRELHPLPLSEVLQIKAGLVKRGDSTYFVNTTPVDVASEFLGTIVVGRKFSLADFSSPVILTRDGRVVKSNLTDFELLSIEADLVGCADTPDCELTFNNEQYLLVALKDLNLGNGFELRSLQSVDLAVEPLQAVVVKVFLVVGLIVVVGSLLLSWLLSRSVVRPLSALVDDMRTRLASTRSAEAIHLPKRGTDELNALMGAFNEMLGQIEDHEVNLERQVQSRTAELKTANADLVIAKERADEGNRLKSHFLANMSHEIRTPLSIMLGMTELAYDVATQPKQKTHLGLAREAGAGLLSIVNDILDFSKIEAGEIELRNAEFDVRTTLEQTVAMLAPKAREKGLLLSCDAAPDVPQRITGDEGRLTQVLVNLAGNAIKFSDEGSVALHADLDNGDSNSIHFVVVDTGIGIPKAMQADIFERFRQVDGSATRRHGGTGLGLAIARQLVEAMGGRIWIDSEQGRGSAFHFTVRVESATQEITESPENPRKGNSVVSSTSVGSI